MNSVFPIYLQGLFIGASLIIAIGAQNAFVLTQSIRRNHAYAVAALCALIDVLLITVGVCGMGSLVANNVILSTIASLGGAAFLFWFGLRSLLEARKAHSLETDTAVQSGLIPTLMATLAVSLLNPHVYLDTVIMLGAISGNYGEPGRYWFGAGAGTASVVWFFGLCVAGQALAPLFKRPVSWKILHILVACMVWWVAFSLLKQYLFPV